MDMGLAHYEPGENPFMLYIDKNGVQRMVFGQFGESTASGRK